LTSRKTHRRQPVAEQLGKVAVKAPALKKKFKDADGDDARAEKMAGYAQKMLVEENCSDDDAVKRAKDADGSVKAGLVETDALMSSRVKRSLVAGATKEDVAQEIGKNLRSSGTATAGDAKAVAHGMRNMSKKVLQDLNKAVSRPSAAAVRRPTRCPSCSAGCRAAGPPARPRTRCPGSTAVRSGRTSLAPWRRTASARCRAKVRGRFRTAQPRHTGSDRP
jgi:hypothetical protein